MSREAKHTPTPWMVARAEVIAAGTPTEICWIDAADAPSEGIADLYHKAHDVITPKRNAAANAELIVRAVNAHDDLVAAVFEALNMIDGDGQPPNWDFLRAALAKALPPKVEAP